jgi:hypothetical protein
LLAPNSGAPTQRQMKGKNAANEVVEGLLRRIPSEALTRFAMRRLQHNAESTADLTSELTSDLSPELHFRELMRFLVLTSLGVQGLEDLISERLDLVWHALILETRLYAEICSALPAPGFIHHTGLDHDAWPAVVPTAEAKLERGLCALSNYVANFGGFEERVLPLWPAVADLRHTLGLTLDELNTRLSVLAEASEETP